MKISDYFGSYFLGLIKKVFMKNLNISLFLNLRPSYLNKVLITNSSCEFHKSRSFEVHHEVLINKSAYKNSKFVLQSLGV